MTIGCTLIVKRSLLQSSVRKTVCYPAGRTACIWCRMRNQYALPRYRKGAATAVKRSAGYTVFGEVDLCAQQVGLLVEILQLVINAVVLFSVRAIHW